MIMCNKIHCFTPFPKKIVRDPEWILVLGDGEIDVLEGITSAVFAGVYFRWRDLPDCAESFES